MMKSSDNTDNNCEEGRRRIHHDDNDDPALSVKKKKPKVTNYKGYTLPSNNNGTTASFCLHVIDATIDPKTFFEQYVSQRKPCILAIKNVVSPDDDDAAVFIGSSSSSSVVLLNKLKTLPSHDVSVQVERRLSRKERFGQSRDKERQVNMPISSFVEKCIKSSNKGEEQEDDDDDADMYYLSVQERKDDDTSSNPNQPSSSPPPPFFGPPCDALMGCKMIPDSLPIAGNLVLQSCNLWMGSSSSSSSVVGTHSGLHHDFHDNFYCLLSGRKEFRLFAPTDYKYLALAGDVGCCHENGLLSYRNHPTRADGVHTTTADDDFGTGGNDGGDSEGDESNAVVLGKGFDYESSEDDEKGETNRAAEDTAAAAARLPDDDNVQVDDFEQLNDGGGDDDNVDVDAIGTSRNEGGLPDHFSWIDPTLEKEKISETFPSFTRSRECAVHLRPGQCLYLPASWFHCVVSRGGEGSEGSAVAASSLHMAFNYWYYPPDDLADYECPYRDKEYWQKAKK